MIQETTCKTALVRSRIRALDYAVNPYVGCVHGCVYCYATFMARYSGHSESWGSFVDVKVNLPEVLASEVGRRKPGKVAIGTVCDPYQPAEAEYGLTRSALEILGNTEFAVSVVTKSDLVLRDRDVLRQIPGVVVGMTVTSLDSEAVGFFEPGAPSVARRFQAIGELIAAGIEVEVFFGPVLPYFSDRQEAVEEMFVSLKGLGVRRVLVDKFNYMSSKYPRIRTWLSRNRPEALSRFEYVMKQPGVCGQELREVVQDAVRKTGLDCGMMF